MKKEKEIVIWAREAKAAGYIYAASVVKSHFNTTYYHVVALDRIIAAGKWIPAPHNYCGWHGRIGRIIKDWTGIIRRCYNIREWTDMS